MIFNSVISIILTLTFSISRRDKVIKPMVSTTGESYITPVFEETELF